MIPLLAPKPNLLVSFNPAHQGRAHAEITRALAEVGELSPRFTDTKVEGLAQLRVRGDPKQVVHALHQLVREMPEIFAETYRWIPLDRFTRASRFQIRRAAKEANRRIDDSEEWAIRVEKRHSDLHTDDVTNLAAGLIHHPHVNLADPQKEVRFEIIGGKMGVAVLTPGEKLNVNEVRRTELAPQAA